MIIDYIFSMPNKWTFEMNGGDMFNDVNKKMAISFSIWKLHPNRQSLLTECIYKWSFMGIKNGMKKSE